MSAHSRVDPDFNKNRQHLPDLSRRGFCKGLGLVSAAVLLGGCERLLFVRTDDGDGETRQGQTLLSPKQFASTVGTVEEARDNIARGVESPSAFLERFLAHSPRIQAASMAGGTIGSVLYNPRPEALASAVKLQLSRGRGEPELLHNDLGQMAAEQYARFGKKSFAAVFPSTASIIGETIHKDRSLLQLCINGNLPSEKIVCTNEDLDSLIGRQLTFASQMVHGVRCGTGAGTAPIKGPAIRMDEGEPQNADDGTVGITLVSDLIRLEVTGNEVKAITPLNAGERPEGWQTVSAAYRNFAVGQLIEAERAVAQHTPRTRLEKIIVTAALNEYRPYLEEIKKRLDWGHTCTEEYKIQKQEGRADLLVQRVLLHHEGARKQL